MSRQLRATLLVSFCACIISTYANSASFDCRAAKHPNEKLICQSAELSALDDRMVDLYNKLYELLGNRDRQEIKESQRSWLKERLDCDDDFLCTKRAYTERIERLSSVYAKVTSSSSATVEQCRVSDPDPPLNVRTGPNGRIVGKLNNGTIVTVLDGTTVRGDNWVYVRTEDGVSIGWVFRDYLDCEQKSVIAAPAPTPAQKPPVEGVYWGTGFFISPEGHIVTNAHVVDGCRNISASRGSRISRFASDEASDLALLTSSEKPRYWASLRGGRGPRVAESVMTIGYPLKGLLSSDPIVTTGIISALAGMKDDRRVIQITAPVQPGNSGGPLLGENGSVVGVVVGKLDALKVAEKIGDIPQNINFAVSLGTLQSFLNTHGVPYVFEESNVTKCYADIAAEATRYTVQIQCSR
jgi:S1-C subfamily serine protease